MDTKQEIIRRYFREYDSIRKISRDLQISRITVKKQLSDYVIAEQASDSGVDQKVLQDYLSSPPQYDSRNRCRRKLTSEIENLIIEQLEENRRKRQEGLRKQIKRKIDIWEYVLSQGQQIGYTTVCNYIREKELRQCEAYIKQTYLAGEECEFDWAEVKLVIRGVRKRLYLAVFTSAYSNYRHCRLYHRQDTLAFMEAHNDFFAHIGGVYQEMVYDNMRVVVRDFVGRSEKTPTEALVNLSGWFQYRWRFCNVRSGNEKGHVERSVEYVRRKAFSHTDTFDSLEQAQAHLQQTCDHLNALCGSTGKTPMQEFLQERPSLWKYPGQMDCFLTHDLKVDKYSTICFGTNRYSVGDHLVGRMVQVKVYTNELKFYYGHLLICRHDRNYGQNQWIICLDHYLKTLSRKPGALHGSIALHQAPPPVQTVYGNWFTHQPRDFIHLLQFCHQHQVDHHRLLDTALYVNGICPGNVTGEKIMAVLGNQPEASPNLMSDPPGDEIENFANKQLEEITGLITANMEAVV
ncbi:MAG: IS21 family transposase [Methanoregula sp.]